MTTKRIVVEVSARELIHALESQGHFDTEGFDRGLHRQFDVTLIAQIGGQWQISIQRREDDK